MGVLAVMLAVVLAQGAPLEPGTPLSPTLSQREREPASGDGGTDPPEDAPRAFFETRTTAYLDTRFTAQRVEPAAPLPSESTPALANLTEGNLTFRVQAGPRLVGLTDASLFWQRGGRFYTRGPDGARTRLPPRDVPSLRPALVVNELYAEADLHPHLRLTAGKKRVVWGPGLALNPTDVLNPPKDPTDPSGQRAGAWLVRAEAPFERVTLTLVAAGRAVRQSAGLPTALVRHPDHPTDEAARGLVPDDRDGEAHYALVARAYALVADTDVNVLLARTNLYADALQDSTRVGVTVSRTLGPWGVHGEALAFRGSGRLYAQAGCAGAVEACLAQGRAPLARSRAEDGRVRVRALAGVRYFFEDGGLLSAEYAYLGDGLTRGEYAAFVATSADALALVRARPELAPLLAGGGAAADPGSPQKFAFEPLRRHALFLSWRSGPVADDWTLSAAAVASLSDLSGQLAPGVTWAPEEWLQLSGALFVPVRSPGRLAPARDGRRWGELNLAPTDWRGLLSARVFL